MERTGMTRKKYCQGRCGFPKGRKHRICMKNCKKLQRLQ